MLCIEYPSESSSAGPGLLRSNCEVWRSMRAIAARSLRIRAAKARAALASILIKKNPVFPDLLPQKWWAGLQRHRPDGAIFVIDGPHSRRTDLPEVLQQRKSKSE